VRNVAGPLRRLAGADLGLLAEAPDPRPPAGHQHVLGDTGPVGGRAVAVTGLEAQPVDFHGLPAVGTAVVAHVEQSRLDAGGGDPNAGGGDPAAGPVRDQGRERHAERARERVQRAQGRVAGAVLDLRQRPLADVRRLGQRAEGQAAFPPRRPQALAYQPGQIVHDRRF
jgi:hypothetical protein